MGSATSQHAGSIPLPQLRGQIHWAHYGIQGKRPTMEDAFLVSSLGAEAVFGVFDGHYGKRAAIYAAENLSQVIQNTPELKEGHFSHTLKIAFENLDKQMLERSRLEDWQDGTTALVALLAMTAIEPSQLGPMDLSATKNDFKPPANTTEKSKVTALSPLPSRPQYSDELVTTADGKHALTVYIANAGDCRAISCYGDGRVYQISTDHNPIQPYERYRIYKAGGTVRFGRIEGKLSVSRGFGDRQFKEPKVLVSPVPEILSFAVTKKLRFLVLACDGVWGWLNNIQVATFVTNRLRDGARPEAVCKDLVKYAYEQGSTDNISVVLLYFTFEDDLPSSPRPTDSPQTSARSGSSTLKQSFSGPVSTTDDTTKPSEDATTNGVTSETTANGVNGSKSPAPVAKTESGPLQRSLDAPLRSSEEALINKVSFRPELSLSSNGRNKKFNFSAVAESSKWNTHFDLIDRKQERSRVITTHLSTGEESYWDGSSASSTSELDSVAPKRATARRSESSVKPPAKWASPGVARQISPSRPRPKVRKSNSDTPRESAGEKTQEQPAQSKDDLSTSSTSLESSFESPAKSAPSDQGNSRDSLYGTRRASGTESEEETDLDHDSASAAGRRRSRSADAHNSPATLKSSKPRPMDRKNGVKEEGPRAASEELGNRVSPSKRKKKRPSVGAEGSIDQEAPSSAQDAAPAATADGTPTRELRPKKKRTTIKS